MDELKFSLDSYDLKTFIGEIIDFLMEQGIGDPDPVSAIPVVEADGSTPDLYGEASDRILYDELVRDHKTIYFPFSITNNGDPIPCADGREYTFPETEDSDIDEDESFSLGDMDTVGFFVSVENNEVKFKLSKQFLGGCMIPPMVDVKDNTGIFEDGMLRFAKKFKE